MLGLTILSIAVSLYISKSHTETEAGAVAALGVLLLRAKDSLIGKIWCSIIHPIVGTVGRVLSLLNTVRGN